MANLNVINVKDFTVQFKDIIYELKSMFNIDCLKHINYLTNMYVYENTVMYNGHLINFKTQTGETINQFTITYLN